MKLLSLKTAVANLFLVAAGSPALAPAQSVTYYPRVAGPPLRTFVGTLTELGFGMKSGGLTVRLANGRSVNIYLAQPPFRIDGRRIDCPIPPQAGFDRDPDNCPVWPASVVIGKTQVRVPVWTGRRDGKPTLIARELRTMK